MDENNIQSAIDAGKSIAAAQMPGFNDPAGNLLKIVHGDFRVERFQAIDPLLPKHINDRKTFIDAESFAEYANRFSGPSTTIFAFPFNSDQKFAGTFEAHLDYHHGSESKDKAGSSNTNSHLAVYGLVFSEDFKRWKGCQGKLLTQVAFANFIEEMLHTIADPSGASLLEMAQDLQINRGVVARNSKRLADSTISIEYTEKDETTVKGGKVIVPEDVTIVVPVFLNSQPIEIKAKLRYSFEKGEPLTFEVRILNIDTIILDEFKELASVVEGLTGLKPLLAY